jgi:hypothetical protein
MVFSQKANSHRILDLYNEPSSSGASPDIINALEADSASGRLNFFHHLSKLS